MDPVSTRAALPPTFWVDAAAPDDPPPLDARWLRGLAALAEVMFATDAGAAPAARVRWMCHELRDLLRRIRGRGTFVFHLALVLVSIVAPLLVARPVPLRRLPFAVRARALARFERSPLGLLLFVLKAMMCIVWFEHPGSAREVGFDGRALREHPSEAAA